MLKELQTFYSLSDLADMVEAIEYQNACENLLMQNINKEEPKAINISCKDL